MQISNEKSIFSFKTIVTQISKFSGIAGIFFLIAMLIITVADVFLRYFFNAPITGTVEIIERFMVVAGFFGAAWCAVKGGHLKVDIFMNRLPGRIRLIADSITLLMGMTVVAVIAWQGFSQAMYSLSVKSASDLLEIPDYPFYFVVGLGYTFLFLVLVSILADNILKVIKNEP